MKVLVVTRWKDGKQELFGVYESVSEFVRTNKVQATPFKLRYTDDVYSYQIHEVPFVTNDGIHHSTKDGEPVLKYKVLTTVSTKVPTKSERNYNFMTLGSAMDNYQNNKIATICGADFSTAKFQNEV